MIPAPHLIDYRGLPLESCLLDGEDITPTLIHAYGATCNWQASRWTYRELFGPDSLGKSFAFSFKDGSANTWFYGYVHDLSQHMIPPRFLKA